MKVRDGVPASRKCWVYIANAAPQLKMRDAHNPTFPKKWDARIWKLHAFACTAVKCAFPSLNNCKRTLSIQQSIFAKNCNHSTVEPVEKGL